MNFYDELGIKPLINASETYTNLGGSLMDPRTFQAMQEAGSHFVDFNELLDKVCQRAAELTGNEAAFVTTGAAAGVILATAACMYTGSIDEKNTDHEKLLDCFPASDKYRKNELLIFDGAFLQIIPYWKLSALTGAKIIPVQPTAAAIREAVNEHTAGFILFPAPLYEKDILTCEEAIPIIKELNINIIVDAAAQLPPASNLWYYTKKLGADLVIFSGGKHIRGPQSTGLIAGRKDLIDAVKQLASPNPRIGRAFKTGKEELAGFITALEIFVKKETETEYNRQEKLLVHIKEILERQSSPVTGKRLSLSMQHTGRLGTCQPLLSVSLPDGKTAKQCNEFTRNYTPAIDIGVYSPEFNMPENMIFINAYNLKEEETDAVAQAVCSFLSQS